MAKKMHIKLKACSSEQVFEIQNYAKQKLPKAYIEFLEAMGQGTTPGFLTGHSCFFNEISMLNEGAIELLEETEFEKPLPDNAFVFWMSQGTQFTYFLLEESDNPQIYYYREYSGQGDFKKITNNLCDFLLGILLKKENQMFTV